MRKSDESGILLEGPNIRANLKKLQRILAIQTEMNEISENAEKYVTRVKARMKLLSVELKALEAEPELAAILAKVREIARS